MHPCHRKTALALVLSLLAAGCAVQQRVDPAARVDKLTRDDMRYQAVRVEPFTISTKGVKEKDPEAYLRKAQETCVRVLTRSGLFDAVTAGPAEDASDPALVVRAELTALKIVSSGDQKWLGTFAGRSVMKVRVTLTDAQSGKQLRTVQVEQDEETAAGPWSFGATDRSLPAEVGTRIAEVAAANATK
jgi:hypothetical protein